MHPHRPDVELIGPSFKGEIMSDANDIYHPPQHISNTALPDELVDFLDGESLDRKTSQALRLSTVDERGWPHAAMLSAGDITALDHSRIGIALCADSTTSKNLTRDGRLTLTFPCGRGLCEVRLRAIEKKADGQSLLHSDRRGRPPASCTLRRRALRRDLPPARSRECNQTLEVSDRLAA